MQVINLKYPVAASQIPAGPIVLALGFFDGVHRDINKSSPLRVKPPKLRGPSSQ